MDDAFRQQLPSEVDRIVQRIESFSLGKSINVRVNPGLPQASSQVTPAEAVIELPRDDDIEGLVHETLHVERSWPDQIPQMFPADPAFHDVAAYVDNVLEHLVILPRQWGLGFGQVEDLTPGFRRDWAANSRFRTCPNRRQRYFNLLILYLTLAHFAGGSAEHSNAQAYLGAEGILRMADGFYQRMAGAIDSKERMVGIAVDTLDIRAGILLVRSDPRDGTCPIVSIPAVPYA